MVEVHDPVFAYSEGFPAAMTMGGAVEPEYARRLGKWNRVNHSEKVPILVSFYPLAICELPDIIGILWPVSIYRRS